MRLEGFLLELGSDFAFIGRQKRLRIGEEWFRVDLLLFHRRLRSLVVVDLKLGKFSHADAGQMHTYLNYAREHWQLPHENPPVGLILCAQGDQALAHYALEGLQNTVLAAEYRTVLPSERVLAEALKPRLPPCSPASPSSRSRSSVVGPRVTPPSYAARPTPFPSAPGLSSPRIPCAPRATAPTCSGPS